MAAGVVMAAVLGAVVLGVGYWESRARSEGVRVASYYVDLYADRASAELDRGQSWSEVAERLVNERPPFSDFQNVQMEARRVGAETVTVVARYEQERPAPISPRLRGVACGNLVFDAGTHSVRTVALAECPAE